MKHIALSSAFATIAVATFCAAGLGTAPLAQTNDSLMLAHHEWTASGYSVYPEPGRNGSNTKLTKAPAGYKPFYISHYARHGSRFHYSADDYHYLYNTLAKADSAGKLTPLGKSALERTRFLSEHAAPRTGDLTQVGVGQHQGIAKRMAKNFPEVFRGNGGKGKSAPHVDAFASTSGRCIVSMAAFVSELRANVPNVDVRLESGKSLMQGINTFDFKYTKDYAETEAYHKESDKLWKNISFAPTLARIFSDSNYVKKNVNASDFYNKLYEIHGSMQGMDAQFFEGTQPFNFNDLFTPAEELARWKAQNAWWYSVLGSCPLTGEQGVTYGKSILTNILDEADKAVTGASGTAVSGTAANTPVATLRFGHDTGILPLAGLMQLPVANARVTDLSKLHEQWTDFKIIPMAANLQIVFYKASTGKNAKPVLVKVLYNEVEQELPVPCGYAQAQGAGAKANCPAAPYYRWDDFSAFYRNIAK